MYFGVDKAMKKEFEHMSKFKQFLIDRLLPC